jgi:predicted CxxxxCH...CXXCH cytochrome family protein
LPDAHDIHVDEFGDLGHDYACNVCHTIPVSMGHQNGIVEVTFPALAYTDGDEAVAGSGGAVKFGLGTPSDYYTCENVYCHGDFDDAGLGGGNAANAPNWSVSADGDCGTCHGDTGGVTESLRAVPVTGNSGTIHPNHVGMATSPEVTCTVCHYISWGGATNGTYGNVQQHANGTLFALELNGPANSPSQVIADYENLGAAPAGSYGSVTCSNVRCHNGVTTPVWSDSSIPAFGCGDCHQDAAGTSPLPTWNSRVDGSHDAHADTDSDYTDCDNCHGVVAGVYTAFGGTNHQNLVVELDSLPGIGATTATYSDPDPAGVNWSGFDYEDDGTCSNVRCHGSGTPVWGGTVTCGECHIDTQLPPTTGAHTPHFAAVSGSNTDYTECVACHGAYLPTHADGTVDVNGSGVAYDSTNNTCNTSVCHSPVSGSQATASAWTSTETLDCFECHYYEAVPADSGNKLWLCRLPRYRQRPDAYLCGGGK